MSAFFALLWATLVRAAEPTLPDPLTPEAFATAVLEVSPSLEAARAARDAAEARSSSARVLPETRLSVGVAPATLTHEPPGYELALEQMLPAPGLLRAARVVSLAADDVARQDLDDARSQLRAASWRALIEAWQAGEALAAAEEQRALMASLAEAARGRMAGGMGMGDGLWMAEADLARMDAELPMMRVRRDLALQRMNALLNRPPDAPLPALTLDGPAPMVAPASPALKAAEARAELARAEVDMARAMSRPMPGLMVEHTTLMSMDHMTVVGVSLTLPWGAEAGSAEARAMAAMAEADLRAMSRETAAMQTGAQAELEAAKQQAQILEERLLPLAERRLEAARAGLAAGTGELDAVVLAARELRAARLELADAHAATASAQAEILSLSGPPETITLEAP